MVIIMVMIQGVNDVVIIGILMVVDVIEDLCNLVLKFIGIIVILDVDQGEVVFKMVVFFGVGILGILLFKVDGSYIYLIVNSVV